MHNIWEKLKIGFDIKNVFLLWIFKSVCYVSITAPWSWQENYILILCFHFDWLDEYMHKTKFPVLVFLDNLLDFSEFSLGVTSYCLASLCPLSAVVVPKEASVNTWLGHQKVFTLPLYFNAHVSSCHTKLNLSVLQGKGEMRTFWLAGREGEERTRQFCEEVKLERNETVKKYRYVL